LVLGRLRDISEGIPLILETIIQLRQTSATWDDAISEFQGFGGSDVRRYLFNREYEALQNKQAKLVLAALALFEGPASFEEIQYALKFDKSTIHDGLGAISEMFLNRVAQDDDTTLFTIGEVTREFVLQESIKLDHFDLLKSRIANYQKPFSGKNKSLLLITEKVDSFLSRGESGQAAAQIDAVTDAEILEHRDYKLLAVRVYSDPRVARIIDARRIYNDLFAMKVRNPKIYRDWVAMERRTDTSYHNVCNVCDKVFSVDWIKDDDKLYFHFTKANMLYNHARELLTLNAVDAFSCLADAMNHHLIVFNRKSELVHDFFARSEEYCVNTMHNLIQAARRFGVEKELYEYFDRIFSRKTGPILDPIAIPLQDYVRSLPDRGSKDDLARIFSQLSRLSGIVFKGQHLFRNKSAIGDLKSAILAKQKVVGEASRKAAAN
jgi:hypothetical protein